MSQSLAPPVPAPDFSYDQVPYEGYVYRNTHPDYLHAIGTLFGMSPPPFETARVLEVGCGIGGNLLPLALRFPRMTLTGIDLSAEEIAEADRLKKALTLENVTFLKKNIVDVGEADGPFDYIICHGVFSWVPDEVREAILDVCQHTLSPHGVALISYNALPGWHAVTAARDMMRYHAELFQAPKDKIAQALMLLDFVAENTPEDTSYYKIMIQNEKKMLAEANSAYIYHDHLSQMNKPFYLHQFAALLPPHGLQYVGDTNLALMYARNRGEVAAQHLARIGDPVRQEQYIDFLINRRFRSSIITHRNVALNRKTEPGTFFRLSITANAFPEAGANDPHKPVVFRKKEGGGHFTSTNPVITAFLLALVEAGRRPVSADDLAAAVPERLGMEESAEMRQTLGATGLELVLTDFINLHGAPGDFVTKVSRRPSAYAVARVEAADNPLRDRLTTAGRESVNTDRFSNILVVLVDGSRDITALTRAMAEHVTSGDVVIGRNRTVEGHVREALDKFAQMGLLVN